MCSILMVFVDAAKNWTILYFIEATFLLVTSADYSNSAPYCVGVGLLLQSPRVCCLRWAYAMPMDVLFVSSTSYIVFNPSAGAITDYSQSAKNIDSHFNSQIYVVDPSHGNPVLILLHCLSKAGERAYVRNKILLLVGFEPTRPQLLDRQASFLLLRYHR